MSGPVRKLSVIAAVLVALVAAAGAGALVRATIFTISYHQFARLSGTKLFCVNAVDHKQRAFVCSDLLPRGVPRTYNVVVGQPGIEVGRWSANGNGASTIRKLDNP